MIFINVTCYSEKNQSGIAQPMVGLQVTGRGYTFPGPCRECVCNIYKTFMEQTLMRMSERFTMNVHTVNII